MRLIRFRYLLAAGAVAAMVGAPVAGAQDQTCQDIGNATECSSPDNVQITDAPPAVAANGFGGGFYGGVPYPVPLNEGRR